MSRVDRRARKEIVASVIALLDLIPERELEIIQTAMDEESEVSFSKLKRITGLSGPQADSLAAFLRNLSVGKDLLLVALQAAIASKNHSGEDADSCDLIWTGPIQFPIPARSTMAVMMEMIDGARDSVTIVGYRIEEYAEPLIKALHSASTQRNVRIRIVLDRASDQISIIKKIWKEDYLPEFYSRKKDIKDPMASIHAKLIVVDSSDLLITSANLTYHGLSSNLEMGIRLRGKTADRAERLIWSLIQKKHLVLMRLS
ncbi:MAG: phospholipase D-like domain-containing protein, partial [Nitrososphaera sp.]